MTIEYDPYARGRFPVGVRTLEAHDSTRNRRFPCEIWYPAAARYAGEDLDPETLDVITLPSGELSRRQAAVRDAAVEPGTYPLVVYSHSSGRWNRRTATFLCTHLASHGYVIAALDHSEVVATELARRSEESDEERKARVDAIIASRVPDVQFLLDHLLDGNALGPEAKLDRERIGIVGHSFGGWTALAATEADRRIRAVVALAPGGSSRPRPGILPAKLAFQWGRDVPALYLVADNDVMTPLDGMYELFERTPGTKRMAILRRADHLHFMDDVVREHETVRGMPWPAELSWIPKEMRPAAELCSEEEAHRFVRGLTVSHLDAVLRAREEARRFLPADQKPPQ